jgi:hypothetical protein
MWYEALAIFFSGFFLGMLVVALCAISRCADCRVIGQMFGAGET